MGEDREVWFAEERTSTVGGLGGAHGAYWSGEEVAREWLFNIVLVENCRYTDI